MANPVITCPTCNKKFRGKEELEGKRIRCPFCKEPFVVPASESQAIKKAPAKAGQQATQAPQKRATDWDDEDEDSNPYAVTDLDLRARCPHCAQPMASEDAVVCLYCGYNIQTPEIGKTEKVIALSSFDPIL